MKKINIVIPMAGRGSRFSEAGYKNPKPMIQVKNMPMIEFVVKNLTPKKYSPNFIFICQKDILQNIEFTDFLQKLTVPHQLISIDYITNGAAETVLLAREHINNDDHLMVANCDQFVDIEIDDYLDFAFQSEGCIMTMYANHPKWSYIKYINNKIVDVVEKEVVSDDATVGIYNFQAGKMFVNGADAMIQKDKTVNGEFYVAPVYKELIEGGMNITIYDVSGRMHGLGTPEDLVEFEAHIK
jgi:NDP-sugar pyrophosphorylase family protein